MTRLLPMLLFWQSDRTSVFTLAAARAVGGSVWFLTPSSVASRGFNSLGGFALRCQEDSARFSVIRSRKPAAMSAARTRSGGFFFKLP